MGRPKIDHSETVCSNCKGKGNYHAKGLCKVCYFEKNHRQQTETHEEYLVKRRAYTKKWNEENPQKYKENKLKWRLASIYGLTVEEFRKMETDQNGVCFICKKSQETGRLLSVDHDHETGEVRSLLCNRCNFIVGDYETNPPEIFEAVKDYLISFKQVSPTLP